MPDVECRSAREGLPWKMRDFKWPVVLVDR